MGWICFSVINMNRCQVYPDKRPYISRSVNGSFLNTWWHKEGRGNFTRNLDRWVLFFWRNTYSAHALIRHLKTIESELYLSLLLICCSAFSMGVEVFGKWCVNNYDFLMNFTLKKRWKKVIFSWNTLRNVLSTLLTYTTTLDFYKLSNNDRY